PVPYSRWFKSYPRQFLEISLSSAAQLQAVDPASIAFLPWTESCHDEAAKLIANSYKGHIDSQINDQYRTPAGARRFLTNIVQYPGCGAFFGPGSFAAWDKTRRTMCGISLASLVAAETGHVTQICVAPQYQGKGIGFELMRRSLTALAAQGCSRASLTVTSMNASAVRLYEHMGFRHRRDFAAYAWEPR